MSSIAPQPETPTPEDLVAYLDGELTPDECRRVEQRLAADEGYRQQLRQLDQAWEALDSLPTAKSTDDFARTTMELVTVAAEGEASKVSATADQTRRNRLMWQIAAGAAAVALSFVIARAILPDPNRQLLEDLPVIRQAEALQLVPSVEFLRQLAVEVPADSLMTDEEAAQKELMQVQLISAESPGARRRWVASQSAQQQARLAAQAKRFNDLVRIRGERERLKDLERGISQAKDSAQLQRTLVNYGQWLAGRSAGQQEQLREEMVERSTEDQVNVVREFVQLENVQASLQLSDADAERLRREVQAIVAKRQDELVRDLRRRGELVLAKRLEGPEGALMVIARTHDRDDNEIRDKLVGTLSPNARAHLDRLKRPDRQAQLWHWVQQSLKTKVGPDDLERFFADKLDNDTREQLLNMPVDEMQSRLERLYFASELGSGDAAPWLDERSNAPEERRGPPGGRDRDFWGDGPRRAGPPGGQYRGPDPPPRGFGERMPPGRNGPRGPGAPRDDERRDGRPPRFDGPGVPPDGPPPGGPPEDI